MRKLNEKLPPPKKKKPIKNTRKVVWNKNKAASDQSKLEWLEIPDTPE